MPYDAGVIMEKSLEVCCSVCKSCSNAVEKTCVVACNMKCFEKQSIVWLDGMLQDPIIIHLVETQM